MDSMYFYTGSSRGPERPSNLLKAAQSELELEFGPGLADSRAAVIHTSVHIHPSRSPNSSCSSHNSITGEFLSQRMIWSISILLKITVAGDRNRQGSCASLTSVQTKDDDNLMSITVTLDGPLPLFVAFQ